MDTTQSPQCTLRVSVDKVKGVSLIKTNWTIEIPIISIVADMYDNVYCIRKCILWEKNPYINNSQTVRRYPL